MIANWDGISVALGGSREEGDSYLQLDPDSSGEDIVSAIPDIEVSGIEAPVELLLWPLERLLQRYVSLPLSHPRFLDAGILGQELAEQSGEEPDNWWLTWHAEAVEGAVCGLVFALPEQGRALLSSHPLWKDCPYIAVDAWARLSSLLPYDDENACAVVDADAQGIFLGFHVHGVWKGMRRLNHTGQRRPEDIAEDAMRSLQAMGFRPDEHTVYGRLDRTWADLLRPRMPEWHIQVVDSLPDRHQANLQAAGMGEKYLGPNFRHGTWGVRKKWRESFRPWRWTAILAGCLLLLLLGRDIYTLHQLRQQELGFRQGIEDAFHRGLPEEKVVIDPLAQLRAEAGSASRAEAWAFLRQLQAVADLKKSIPALDIEELLYLDNGMRLRGKAEDFAMVNRIRDTLAGILGRSVVVEDTELEGKQVRFRIKWS